ncbi:MAG: DUF3293 domain-containing protein [Campylobacterota bacterium]|nr:DUF3293 domain-containing protein [Campylobacterota bacterium]
MTVQLIDIYRRNKFLFKNKSEEIWVGIEELEESLSLDIPFAIITAWNPMNRELSEAENKILNHKLEDDLKALKYEYEGTVGKCDEHKEDSFIVYRISKNDALSLGMKYEQYSIFYNSYHFLEYIECQTKKVLLKSSKIEDIS